MICTSLTDFNVNVFRFEGGNYAHTIINATYISILEKIHSKHFAFVKEISH